MPIYEYRCEACGHEMDHFHRTRSEPEPPCKACGEDRLERLVSLSAFHLKGSGWYATDYKSDKKQTNGGVTTGSGASKESADTSTTTAASSDTASGGDATETKKNAGSSQGEGDKNASAQSKDAA